MRGLHASSSRIARPRRSRRRPRRSAFLRSHRRRGDRVHPFRANACHCRAISWRGRSASHAEPMQLCAFRLNGSHPTPTTWRA